MAETAARDIPRRCVVAAGKEKAENKISAEEAANKEFDQSVTMEDIISSQIHTSVPDKEIPKSPKGEEANTSI